MSDAGAFYAKIRDRQSDAARGEGEGRHKKARGCVVRERSCVSVMSDLQASQDCPPGQQLTHDESPPPPVGRLKQKFDHRVGKVFFL